MSSDVASLTGIDVPTGLLIGGEWTGGTAAPAAGGRPGHGGCADRRRGRHRGGRAGRGQRGVCGTAQLGGDAAPERAECLRRAFELMTDRGEQIARLMSAENGKSCGTPAPS